MSAATHPALVITIGQIRAGQVQAEELLRMAKRYEERNNLVETAHSPVYDDDRGYAHFIRQRFPLESIEPRAELAAECRRQFKKLKKEELQCTR